MDKESYSYQRSRIERQADLNTIKIYRERHKRKTIVDVLREQLTTKVNLQTSFGQAYYFEFILQNPYGHDENIEIRWNDEDLR
jgi:nephrocystin-4